MKSFTVFLAAAVAGCYLAFSLAAGGFAETAQFIRTADPLAVVAICAGIFALTSFLAGMATGDYSWVDRLWSTLPVAFAVYYAVRSAGNPALTVMMSAVILWGARLTFNFARKGGYTGTEDYRWPVLRTRIGNPVFWQLFNLLFICGFQVGLFVLFTLPMYLAVPETHFVPNPAFFIGILLMAAAIAIETIADRQQWRFQTAKSVFKNTGLEDPAFASDIRRGFFTGGLFSHSRHPNYFGELLVWWGLYAAASAVLGTFVHWGLAGPVLLTVLFIGSTIFTESLSAAKYPEYRDYQNRVSPIVPWFRTPEWKSRRAAG